MDPKRTVESLLGCKWSLAVIDALRHGVRRPGRMRASIPGISTKVLNERLAKLLRFGLASKKIYPVVPPRVEYALTPKGKRFLRVLDAIDRFGKT